MEEWLEEASWRKVRVYDSGVIVSLGQGVIEWDLVARMKVEETRAKEDMV